MAPPMKLFVEAESLAGRKILAIAKSACLKVEIAGPCKGVTPTGTGIPELLYSVAAKPVRHTNAIMRRLAHTADCGLIGKTFEDESVIDAWMDWANLDIDHVLRIPGATADKLCNVLESHLKNRTFLVNERLTIADIAVAVSLQPGVEAKGIPEVQKTFPSTVRWLRTCIDHLQLSPAPKAGAAKTGQPVAKAKPEVTSKAAPKADTKGAAKSEANSSKPSAVAKNEAKASASVVPPSVVTTGSSPAKMPVRKKIPKMRLFATADSQAAKKILATARLISLEIDIAGASKNAVVCGSPAPELVIDGATPVKHTNAILRHIARLHSDCELMGETFAEESQADAWLDWSLLEVDHKLTIVDAPVDDYYSIVERHLKSRTFLVGERLTVADVAVAVSLQPALEKTAIAEAKKAYPALARWWLTCASQLNLATTETIAAVSRGSATVEAGSSSPSKKEAKAETKVAKAPVTQATSPTSIAPSWGEQLNGAPVKLFVEPRSSIAKRILVTAKRVGLPIDIVGAPKSQTPSGLAIPELLSGDSKPVRHVNPILRHIAQLVPDCDLMGLSFTHEALIDAWLEWTIIEVDHTLACDGLPVDGFCRVLDSHLKTRTFLVGESGLTLADIAVAVAVQSALVAKGIDELKKTYPALIRWLLTCVHQLELN